MRLNLNRARVLSAVMTADDTTWLFTICHLYAGKKSTSCLNSTSEVYVFSLTMSLFANEYQVGGSGPIPDGLGNAANSWSNESDLFSSAQPDDSYTEGYYIQIKPINATSNSDQLLFNLTNGEIRILGSELYTR